jgi:hypothetical protein
MISDQIDNTEDLEIDGSLEAEDETEAEEIEEESESNDDSVDAESDGGEEEAPAKKSGYVEFSTPEQKARVAEITRKRYEAEREAAKLKSELEQYRKPPEPPKEVPQPTADPVTDPDIYAQQARAREAYIREATKFETESEQRKQQSAQSEQKRMGTLVETYNKNAERLKVSPAVLAKAADVCTQYGITKELVEELLEDEDGPAIVAYLGHNVEDLAEVTSLSTAKAVKYIERQVRAKLNTKQTSKAPPPPTRVNGSRPKAGVVENGTVFE